MKTTGYMNAIDHSLRAEMKLLPSIVLLHRIAFNSIECNAFI